MTIEGDRSGKLTTDSIDKTVEYINKSPDENFVIYDSTKSIVEEIKRRVSRAIYIELSK